MTSEIQVLHWHSICKLLKISLFMIQSLIFYQLLRIWPIFKTWVLRSIFPFCSICQLSRNIFLTSLFLTPLLYIQPLNGIIIIISTTFLSINIVEVMDLDNQRIQVEWNSFLCRKLQLLKWLLLIVMSGAGVVLAAYLVA